MNKKKLKKEKTKKVFGNLKKKSPIIFYQHKNKINYKIKKHIIFTVF